MNSHEYAMLEKAIQKWLDRTLEESENADGATVIGDRTVELMATAARSVFDACEESQNYGLREGLFSTK